MNRPLVVVAKGGTSNEREVGLRGAHRVSAALRELGYEVRALEIDHTVLVRVRELNPQFVFIVAHGRQGEDGGLQALLELLKIPYTGSDSLASALCIDKILTKRLLRASGLPTPPFHAFSRRTFEQLGAATVFDEVLEDLGTPVIVKPARAGSSFGIKLVSGRDQLRPAVLGAVAYDDEIFVERYIEGRELAVTVLGPNDAPRVLPIVEIITTSGYYDYEAHYDYDAATLDAPAKLPDDLRGLVEKLAKQAYQTLGCRDFARVDLMLDTDQRPQVLEINTIPGLTETGPTPFAADAGGMSFPQLVAAIAARLVSNSSSSPRPRPNPLPR